MSTLKVSCFLGNSPAQLNAPQSVFHLSCPIKAASLISPTTPTAEFNRSFQSMSYWIYQKHLTIPPILLRYGSLISFGFHNTKLLLPSSFYLSGCGLPMLFADSLHPTLSQSCTGLHVRPSPLFTTPYLPQENLFHTYSFYCYEMQMTHRCKQPAQPSSLSFRDI